MKEAIMNNQTTDKNFSQKITLKARMALALKMATEGNIELPSERRNRQASN